MELNQWASNLQISPYMVSNLILPKVVCLARTSLNNNNPHSSEVPHLVNNLWALVSVPVARIQDFLVNPMLKVDSSVKSLLVAAYSLAINQLPEDFSEEPQVLPHNSVLLNKARYSGSSRLNNNRIKVYLGLGLDVWPLDSINRNLRHLFSELNH